MLVSYDFVRRVVRLPPTHTSPRTILLSAAALSAEAIVCCCFKLSRVNGVAALARLIAKVPVGMSPVGIGRELPCRDVLAAVKPYDGQ